MMYLIAIHNSGIFIQFLEQRRFLEVMFKPVRLLSVPNKSTLIIFVFRRLPFIIVAFDHPTPSTPINSYPFIFWSSQLVVITLNDIRPWHRQRPVHGWWSWLVVATPSKPSPPSPAQNKNPIHTRSSLGALNSLSLLSMISALDTDSDPFMTEDADSLSGLGVGGGELEVDTVGEVRLGDETSSC